MHAAVVLFKSFSHAKKENMACCFSQPAFALITMQDESKVVAAKISFQA